MNEQNYQNIFNYLSRQEIPSNLTQPKQQRRFKNYCNSFVLQQNFIYKIDNRKDNNFLKVIKRPEMEPLLYMMHNDPLAGHFATDTMFAKIRERYFWPQMYADIREYVQTCDACQRRGKSRINQALHPIPVTGPFHRIGIDFVGPLPLTDKGNRYIIVAIDYLTKWPEARPLPRATADVTAEFLYEEIICRHGCPQEIQSDRGTHFNNHMISTLLERFEIDHRFSTPYHPQSNGLVERFNRTLCEALAKTAKQIKQWDNYVAPILFAYRTSKQATTKITPFFLTYGREAKLPLDDLSSNIDNLEQRIQTIIDKLPNERQAALNEISISQTKQKNRWDQRIAHLVTFAIGDKVLLFDAAQEKQWSRKLDEKWKGPYYVHNCLPNGAYKLRTIDGRVLRAPQNGSYLKLYKDRTHWEPQVTIPV
jgi:transposase InsO family protein